MQLSKYLEICSTSHRQFAELSGISQTRISAIVAGEGMQLDTAALIRHHSGGAVDFDDLITDRVAAIIRRGGHGQK